MQRIVVLIILAEVWFGSISAQAVPTYSRNFNLPIPSLGGSNIGGKGPMDDAIIEITGHGIIHDLEVEINLTHENIFDLEIYLESPSGTVVKLISYAPKTEFFFGEDYIHTIFDDKALISITDGAAPFSGRFKPIAPSMLSTFNGEDIYGEWKLKVADVRYWDTGTFEGFELAITTPEPNTLLLLLMGLYGITRLRSRTV
ncbi:MAG: PEP-CTERM sorting domain-containing protein [Planctomycetes bacterium]|nr:PEP-CTERM sorting domain-containing protein [Planctomycetota bacterium]